jgi:hypothetical protein
VVTTLPTNPTEPHPSFESYNFLTSQETPAYFATRYFVLCKQGSSIGRGPQWVNFIFCP